MVLTFILCMLALITLVVISRVIHMRDLFLGLELNFIDTLRLFMYMIPSFLLIILPISCMLSIFLTFLRMGSDRELIALKAGGVGLYQLLPGPVLFSLACTALAFVISLHGISWGMGSFRTLVLQLATSHTKVVVQPGVFNQDFFAGITFFARQVDPKTGDLREVLFKDDTSKDDSGLTVLAPKASITTDENAGALVLLFENGRIYRTEKNNMSILQFEEYVVLLDLNTMFSNIDLGDVKPREMSFAFLQHILGGDLAAYSTDIYKVLAEIQKRLAFPFACLILGIFALALACSFEGVRQQYGIIAVLVVFLLYYGTLSAGMSLDESAVVFPGVGVWSANGIFAVLALLGLYCAAKEKTPLLPRWLQSLKKNSTHQRESA